MNPSDKGPRVLWQMRTSSAYEAYAKVYYDEVNHNIIISEETPDGKRLGNFLNFDVGDALTKANAENLVLREEIKRIEYEREAASALGHERIERLEAENAELKKQNCLLGMSGVELEQAFVHVIEEWKGFWMNQIANTGDQADHDNYLHRACGVDANMKYNLAKRLRDFMIKRQLTQQSQKGQGDGKEN